ncbi:hypothetical protein ISJ10_23245 [Burkholderia pseudomallei]|uniref:hypothetical protein n=1 Tax=Burkholderia pseudomallei TaxID=28450 RepID=UPI0005D806D5|nr:hypothetical protein [Burkholderia pseudomallei]WGS43423.1 hypothetical protein LFL97_07830 [Burkholderia sp. JSH-S8]AJX93923.1 putative membrane protein [Burkholderia pseudomallei PB08298010]MBF3713336.1 hypothetical protein [Burkholderia pseudomallei]MBF3719444.1 hypothetical protein [Burkholderia pseudomallei]MBF3781843.1 hypothetical protein [Burkholderia pseudomallei]
MLKLPSKDHLESLKIVANFGQASVIVAGVLLAFFYCAAERITPSGLSLGDVFSLVIITLGFGVLMIVGCGYGILATIFPLQCLIWVIERRNRQPAQRIEVIPALQGKGTALMSIFLLALFLLLIYGLHAGAPDLNASRTLSFFPIFGFFLNFVFSTRWPAGRSLAPLSRIALAIALLGAIIGSVHPALLNFTMTIIGVRSEPAALIVVDKDEHARLEELAKQNGLDIRFCKLSATDSWATRDARAIWHNIGSTSYIRLLDRTTNGQRNLRVPIAQDHLNVVGTEGGTSFCKN